MPSYNGEEKCAPMTWATLSGDQYDEILVFTKVQIPDPDEMYDELMDCIATATDERIRSVDANTADKIVNDGPWEIHSDDPGTLLLYKLWYDSITLRMGMKPQVHLHSKVKPNGMPNHWVHVPVPHEVIVIDDDRDAPIPVAEVQPVQPAQRLPWYHPNWVPEVPYWNQPTRKSTRAHSGGVQKLSYDNQGQCESNSVIARAVWESLNE